MPFSLSSVAFTSTITRIAVLLVEPGRSARHGNDEPDVSKSTCAADAPARRHDASGRGRPHDLQQRGTVALELAGADAGDARPAPQCRAGAAARSRRACGRGGSRTRAPPASRASREPPRLEPRRAARLVGAELGSSALRAPRACGAAALACDRAAHRDRAARRCSTGRAACGEPQRAVAFVVDARAARARRAGGTRCATCASSSSAPMPNDGEPVVVPAA